MPLSRWIRVGLASAVLPLLTWACSDSTSTNATAGPSEPRCAADADMDGVCDDADQCAETPEGEPVNATGCPVRLEPVAWSSGPYGTNIRDTAGDFTLETLDGPVTFSQAWTGEDSWVFFGHESKADELEKAWQSDVAKLLNESPPNVHYVFFSAGADPSGDVTALKARFATALGKLADASTWDGRLHFVPTPIANFDPVLKAFMDAHQTHRYTSRTFAIDRFQRWRQTGMLGSLVGSGSVAGEMRFLSRVALGFEYERRIERERAALAPKEVVIADGFVHPGGWEDGNKSRLEVTFPSAEEMKGYDSMAIHAFTSCPDHLEGSENGCPAWDMAHHLILCDEADPNSCNTEFVRYITSYHREGEWRTDISALLPLLASGGKRTFVYQGPNSYGLHLTIQLWKDPAKTDKPIAIRKLFGAAPDETVWDENYNASITPVTFEVDPNATRAEIVSSITGHGFATTKENCAEFCNHQHQFTLNGAALPLIEHPTAGTRDGCYKSVSDGVVPNQYGTWPLGRAGWCPGQDVKFDTLELNDVLRSGQNELAYQVLFQNANYSPAYVTPEPSDPYFPHLRTQVWLVTYGAK